MNDNKELVETLNKSRIFQDYQNAFTETTGLPIALRPVESWQLPMHGKRGENPFCSIVSRKSRVCASCLQLQQRLGDLASYEPQELNCELGLCDIAVPVRMGEQLIGFLITGQIHRRRPTPGQYERVASLLEKWGIDGDREELRKTWFNSPMLPKKQREAVTKLVIIFAQHLSMMSNQIVVQQGNAEPPVIARAKQFIREHQTEDISLNQVARAVNTSPFYFCKMFKKVTGLNFTDYVSRIRIENARNLLLNPNLRISEIAFEVGFQSLTHFNRVFKKIVGRSPSEYRSQLAFI